MNTILNIQLTPIQHRLPQVTQFDCHYELLNFSTYFVHQPLDTSLLPDILKNSDIEQSIKVHVTELEDLSTIQRQISEIIDFIESHEVFVIFSKDIQLLSTAMYYLGYKPQIQ